jgi:hypothetical protein
LKAQPPLPASLLESRAANDPNPPLPPHSRSCRRVPDALIYIVLLVAIAIAVVWSGIGF